MQRRRVLINAATRYALLITFTLLLTACAATGTQPGRSGGKSTGPTRPVNPVNPAAPVPSTPAEGSLPMRLPPLGSTPPPALPPRPSGSMLAPRAELPLGGQKILPDYRVVAYYGGPDGPALGVLGAGTPDQAADAVTARAATYTPYGRRVQPALELIATVAQGAPGPAGTYSAPISSSKISAYLAAAHRHHLLLILDFQPGRSDFLSQVEADSAFLSDPSVSVGLDPEWKMQPGQVPGRQIGSASAADINAVSRYLSGIVQSRHLPDKLLIVHQFTRSMLPDRPDITIPPGVEVVLHADGNGIAEVKISVYRQLAFPGPPFGSGFKLFMTQDPGGPMTPAQVMRLTPRPDVISYQ